jgi:hypothetical protein
MTLLEVDRPLLDSSYETPPDAMSLSSQEFSLTSNPLNSCERQQRLGSRLHEPCVANTIRLTNGIAGTSIDRDMIIPLIID